MGKSQLLRLGEVRAALRLVGECRDLGYDPALWMRTACQGLCVLVGARIVMGGEAHWPRPDGPITPIHSVLVGIPQAVEGDFVRNLREGGLDADVISSRLKAIPAPHLTRTRRQLLPDRAWYRSPQYDGLHRPAGIDHCIATLLELPGGRALLMGLHREAGERDFSERELKLVHLFHDELGQLIGPVLVSASDQFSPTHLPPRVRETLCCLLEGDSEKQAATRMGLSQETVHQYVKALYRHYRVASRAELLARVLRRTNPGG
jgi:DNA-binding CsgD family transcriptional regulator